VKPASTSFLFGPLGYRVAADEPWQQTSTAAFGAGGRIGDLLRQFSRQFFSALITIARVNWSQYPLWLRFQAGKDELNAERPWELAESYSATSVDLSLIP
jgi:hypothetical protein